MRAERLAEIDRRVLLALREEMPIRQLNEDMVGRYSCALVASALRRLERRGQVASRLLDDPPRLRDRAFVGPRRVWVYRRVSASDAGASQEQSEPTCKFAEGAPREATCPTPND